MKPGCYTALVTPFMEDSLDIKGIKRLVDFQIQNGVVGIVAVGTTGESPTMSKTERNKVVKIIGETIDNRCVFIVGSGGNNTKETLDAVKYAEIVGADAVLLVDPYYNGPSSMEIRKEYVVPVAQKIPNLSVIPYVIPSRTGTQLLPEDLAMLFKKYSNVNTIKDATGDIENMRRVRLCCGQTFNILSGDDFMLFETMSDPKVLASGVISAVANIIPDAICRLTTMLREGKLDQARILAKIIEPLINIVTVETIEHTSYSDVLCKARNPLPLKTLMNILGMPSGHCRQPLGKMSKSGFKVIVDTARFINSRNPELFDPISEFFGVDIENSLLRAEERCELFYNFY